MDFFHVKPNETIAHIHVSCGDLNIYSKWQDSMNACVCAYVWCGECMLLAVAGSRVVFVGRWLRCRCINQPKLLNSDYAHQFCLSIGRVYVSAKHYNYPKFYDEYVYQHNTAIREYNLIQVYI